MDKEGDKVILRDKPCFWKQCVKASYPSGFIDVNRPKKPRKTRGTRHFHRNTHMLCSFASRSWTPRRLPWRRLPRCFWRRELAMLPWLLNSRNSPFVRAAKPPSHAAPCPALPCRTPRQSSCSFLECRFQSTSRACRNRSAHHRTNNTNGHDQPRKRLAQ